MAALMESKSLRKWMEHFDEDRDQLIGLSEFTRGMQALNYDGDAAAFFHDLDSDCSGQLTLDEVDDAQQTLWRQFRVWCGGAFRGHKDFLQGFAGRRVDDGTTVSLEQFKQHIPAAGWTHGCEELIFACLDKADKGYLATSDLRWLDGEAARCRRKEEAKLMVSDSTRKRNEQQRLARDTMLNFRRCLRKKYGGFVRAWRNGLSPNDSMVLQKPQFLKACAKLGWGRDAQLLWKTMDKDGGGSVWLDELDPQGAEVFARLRVWLGEKFGNTQAAFRAFDKDGNKVLKQEEFAEALQAHGFEYQTQHKLKLLWHGLDKGGAKVIMEESLRFLDRWKPLAFLTAAPNPAAAERMKAMLLKRYKNYLKAWMHTLDRDNNNSCTWNEFEATCKKVGFEGDAAGAWRALDEDISGFISLGEIDPDASEILIGFRRWADFEFGGVVPFMDVFDDDQSGGVTYQEFRRNARIYGFAGDVRGLFDALDVDGKRLLLRDDVAWLDNWAVAAPEPDSTGEENLSHVVLGNKHFGEKSAEHGEHLVGDPSYMQPTRAGDALPEAQGTCGGENRGVSLPPLQTPRGKSKAAKCACGNRFLADSDFCRKCGAKRPEKETESDPSSRRDHARGTQASARRAGRPSDASSSQEAGAGPLVGASLTWYSQDPGRSFRARKPGQSSCLEASAQISQFPTLDGLFCKNAGKSLRDDDSRFLYGSPRAPDLPVCRAGY